MAGQVGGPKQQLCRMGANIFLSGVTYEVLMFSCQYRLDSLSCQVSKLRRLVTRVCHSPITPYLASRQLLSRYQPGNCSSSISFCLVLPNGFIV